MRLFLCFMFGAFFGLLMAFLAIAVEALCQSRKGRPLTQAINDIVQKTAGTHAVVIDARPERVEGMEERIRNNDLEGRPTRLNDAYDA